MLDLQIARKQFAGWMASEFTPKVIAASALSALLVYMLEIFLILSFGALVFSGQLSSQLPQALGLILVGDALLLGVVSLLSSYAGSLAVAQDTPGAVLGLVAVTRGPGGLHGQLRYGLSRREPDRGQRDSEPGQQSLRGA